MNAALCSSPSRSAIAMPLALTSAARCRSPKNDQATPRFVLARDATRPRWPTSASACSNSSMLRWWSPTIAVEQALVTIASASICTSPTARACWIASSAIGSDVSYW